MYGSAGLSAAGAAELKASSHRSGPWRWCCVPFEYFISLVSALVFGHCFAFPALVRPTLLPLLSIAFHFFHPLHIDVNLLLSCHVNTIRPYLVTAPEFKFPRSLSTSSPAPMGWSGQLTSGIPLSSLPHLLWQYYLEYLWFYEPRSWVARIAYTFRVLAFMMIVPVVFIALLVRSPFFTPSLFCACLHMSVF